VVAASSALVIALFGGVFIGESPISAAQFLWINLLIEGVGLVALVSETPQSKILVGRPHKKNENPVTEAVLRTMIGQTLY